MELADFDYPLPESRIAQEPVTPRDHSWLLVARRTAGGQVFEHKHFYDLIDYFQAGDVLVLNETKVLLARICGKKVTGAPLQVTITGQKNGSNDAYACRIKGHRPRVGGKLEFEKGITAQIMGRDGVEIFFVQFNRPITEVIEQIGELPLPPYVLAKLDDEKKYQTTYAKREGSLAAPTAGLHFTPELIARIKQKGVIVAKVCLHIGLGTYMPIKSEAIEDHRMEPEFFEVTPQTADVINKRDGRLVVVGTTSLKTLESASDDEGIIRPKKGWSDLFIHPGYKLKTDIDMLVTNFHLPRSTLICLVAAYWGREDILAAYAEAVRKQYRFYSFGDSMLLIPG